MTARPTWYVDGGQVHGPPSEVHEVAVLIHGLGGSAEFLSDTAASVSRHLPAMTFDLPGHGAGRHEALDLHSFDQFVDLAEKTLTEQGIPEIARVLFIGHSLGGFVSLELARRRGRGDGVILIDGICFTLAESLGVNLVQAVRSVGRHMALFGRIIALAASLPLPVPVMTFIARQVMTRCGLLWPYLTHPARANGRTLARALHLAGTTMVWRNVHNIRTADFTAMTQDVGPCVLISGAADRFLTPADFDKACHELDVRRQVTLPESGHWVMFDSPDQFATELLAAVGELRATWDS